MHSSVLEFVRTVATEERINGKAVLEIGSANVNGSVRPIILPCAPSRYHGIDLEEQDGFVDEVLDATRILERFGPESWDVVVCCEMLEHAEDWRSTLSNIREVLKPGGLLVLTARGPGFPLHCHPHDYWRFTTDDIAAEFQDFATLHLSGDCESHPGFLYAGHKKPVSLTPNPISIMEDISSAELAASTDWKSVEEPIAFYHVAAIGHWREIVSEQLGLLSRSGFKGKIHIGFVGAAHEGGFILHIANACNLDVEIRDFGDDLQQFEFPTLSWMHRVCISAPDRPVLYFHTKGCTKSNWVWTMWRWIMNAYSLNDWRMMVERLEENNCSGFSWHGTGYPVSYFPGNFWWARSSFVKQLTPFYEYVKQFTDCIAKKNPHGFTKRHAAECWINSRSNARPFIYGPEQSRLWDHNWWAERPQKEFNRIAYEMGR